MGRCELRIKIDRENSSMQDETHQMMVDRCVINVMEIVTDLQIPAQIYFVKAVSQGSRAYLP